ncbi:acyl-CoA dehydrogenase family protein [Amycolatopsis ultiminotia]|uniref:Acyl-CoA dehydrogenase family protein n=1 Tax=Amycolatopsis ultiminotia TaxID=543629 RepID=A0ABP6XJG2_9PSEU
MRRTIIGEDHQQFRGVVDYFIRTRVLPVYDEWEARGEVPRQLYRDLGESGILGVNLPEEFGGAGQNDYVYNVVVQEAAAKHNVTLGTLRTHLDVVLPYFTHFCGPEQRARWFPGLVSGDLFTAIALSEPDTGSDLAGVATSARRVAGGFTLTGAKTFITGGMHAELVVVLARTSKEPDRRDGLTLFVVEDGMAGFAKGRKLDKLGLRVQDTVELSFTDVFVPEANVLGEVGRAFPMLTRNLAQERVAISVGAVAQAEAAIELTVRYVRDRRVFGRSLGSFQNTKFALAEARAETLAARTMLDTAIAELRDGVLDPVDAAAVKLYCTEVQGRTVDKCLQLFGGYGYMTEYPIARLFADARVTRIYAGTSEVMKTIVSKSMGLDKRT